jgi:hypothetical protein
MHHLGPSGFVREDPARGRECYTVDASGPGGDSMTWQPRFIDHRGKLILYLDVAHASPGQHAEGLREAQRTILTTPLASVLLLWDVTGVGVNRETEGLVGEFVARTAERIRARAVVGATGLKRRTFDRPARPAEHALFDDLEAARDWLADR